MKYITIIAQGNNEYPIVGTIPVEDVDQKFKEAIETYFDTQLIAVSFPGEDVSQLDDCINAFPIEVSATINVQGIHHDFRLELAETKLY